MRWPTAAPGRPWSRCYGWLAASPSTVGRELPAQQIVAVELASITSGARVLARFMAGFFTAPAAESGILDRGDRR